MHCLHRVSEVVRAGQKVIKMLACGITAHQLRIASSMPIVSFLGTVRHGSNTFELSYLSRISQLHITQIVVDALLHY